MATRLMSVAMAASLAVACGEDDKPAATKREAMTPEATQVEAKPVENKPPEAARPPGAKPKAANITSERQVMFHADTGEAADFNWTYEGNNVRFSLTHERVEGAVAAKITATVNGKRTQIYTCEGLDPAAGGTIEIKALGRNVHIICVNPAHSQGPGSSWGAQLEWNDTTSVLGIQGEWEQADDEGDPDTMDIGEDGMD